MTSLPEALATIVAWRDRLTQAVDTLAPLLAGGVPASVVEVAAEPDPPKALPAPKLKKGKRAVARAPKLAKRKPSTRRIDAGVIAEIQRLARHGLNTQDISLKTGVSWPTVRKYAAAPEPTTRAPKAPARAPKTDNGTGMNRRCQVCETPTRSDPCHSCGAPWEKK